MQFAPIAGQPELLFDTICLKMRAGTELTYARHAPNTLMTATGKSMARIRAARTRRFYKELFEEWAEVGLGAFKLQKKGLPELPAISLSRWPAPAADCLQLIRIFWIH